MDTTQQMWRWADVGSCHMPRSPPRYPTLMIDEGGVRQPAASQVHHKTLFKWIVGNLSWLAQYDTVYIFVDNRALSGASPPDYWQFFAPWIKSRCEVIGPYQEKTTAVYIPINSDTGLDQVHYTWAGAAVLEALCLVYPTVNFVLTDSDCVPTSLFEVAELVNLMTDRASRAEAMQHHTMASSSQCPPAVLLMTESKAELNAGLIIITGHTATQLEDIDMDTEIPDASMPAASAVHPDVCDTRAHKSRRLAHPADRKSPEEWVTELTNSRANFLTTTAVPEDPAEALRGGQGLFGAGKSKSMAVLILALLELDVTDSLRILFICKENSGTRSFADLLLWLDPPSGVLGRIGRLVGDQERNKSSYSHTKFDINPRERRQMLSRCQLVMATGGTVAQDLTMQWSTLGGFMQTPPPGNWWRPAIRHRPGNRGH